MSNSITASKRRLGDCLSFIVDNRGKTPPLSEQGIELIEINAIAGNRKSVDFDAVKKHVSEDTYNTWFRKGHPQVGDTLISTVGAIGRVAFVGKQRGCIAQNVIAMRPDVNLVDPGYLFYVLSSDAIQNRLNSLNIGVAQPSLKVPHLLNVELEFPDLPTQRKIAGVLSAYDDLIENNLRRIKILEQMAQSLYREWFVHFRFPGHESACFTNSSLGQIPKGWVVGKLDDVLVLQRGFDLPKAEREVGEIPIYAASGITGYHSKSKVKGPGIVTGRSGTIGQVVYVHEDFWPLNTALWVKSFPKSKPLYAYFVLSSIDLKGFNSGAAVPTLNRNDIHSLETLIPPSALQNRFQEYASAMLTQARTLTLSIQNLRRTRDLLLPTLLSNRHPKNND